MLPGKTVLNPHAAPYTPLSKKSGNSTGERKAANNILGVSENSEEDGKNAGCQITDTASVECNIQSLEKLQVSDESSSEMSSPYYSFNDTSHDETIVSEKQSWFNDHNWIMESLSAMFPGFSRDSLAKLLNANHGDLDDTVDMLELLQCEQDDLEEASEPSEDRYDLDPAGTEPSEARNDLDPSFQKSDSSGTSTSM